MSLVGSLNASWIGQALSFVGIGSLIDGFMKDEHKSKISAFIFSEKNASFSDFERSTISFLVGLFIIGDDEKRISPLRVAIYSLVSSLAIVVISMVIQLDNPNSDIYTKSVTYNLTVVIVGIVVMTYLSFPGDILSIQITRKLFLGKRIKPTVLPFVWVADLLLSISLPVLLISVLVYLAMREPGTITPMMGALLIAILFGTILSSIFISIVQAIIIIGGMALRMILLTTNLAGRVSESTKLRELPVTMCFIIAYLFIVLVEKAL